MASLCWHRTTDRTVCDLRMRIAMQVGVSENQFLLVFQSRTLKAVQELVDVVTWLGATIFMQGLLKGRMIGQAMMGERGCPACVQKNFGQPESFCFGVASKAMEQDTLQWRRIMFHSSWDSSLWQQLWAHNQTGNNIFVARAMGCVGKTDETPRFLRLSPF